MENTHTLIVGYIRIVLRRLILRWIRLRTNRRLARSSLSLPPIVTVRRGSLLMAVVWEVLTDMKNWCRIAPMLRYPLLTRPLTLSQVTSSLNRRPT